MPDLQIKRTSQTEMQLAHPFVGGWIFAAIGGAIAWAGSTYLDGTSRWLVLAMGAFFALIGVGGGLWRFDLTLDLMARVYRGRRGFWPSPRLLRGSLDELEGVVLTRGWRRSKNNHHVVWKIGLSFRGWDAVVGVYETTNETKAYRKLEELARALQSAAIDRTGARETARAHDSLDETVDAAVAPSAPPPPGVELGTSASGRTMIVLPATGFNAGTLFLALFGLPFLGFGLLALSAALGVAPVEVKGTLTAMWVVGGVFVVFGTLAVAGAIFGTVAREVIRDEGDSIVITLRAFGRHYRRRVLSKRAIEEIEVKESRSATGRGGRTVPTELALRTDATIVRIAGDRPTDEQRWLARWLTAMASR